MKKSRVTYGFLVLAAILAFTVGAKDANALSITGTLELSGQVTPVDSSGNSTIFSSATGLTFSNITVTGATGSYLGLFDSSTFVKYNDFQFDAFDVKPLWETAFGAEFKLTSLRIDATDTTLDLSGWGVIELNGYDDTNAAWTFSGNAGGGTFSFNNNTTAVPEPGTLSLLGIAMVGLIGVVRNRKIKKEKVDS